MPEDFSVDAEDFPDTHDTADLEAPQSVSSYFPGYTPKNVERRKKTIFAAVALILSGVLLLVIGLILVLATAQFSAGVALIVIGCLCFIPGSYVSFILYKAFRGTPGYSVDGIPEFF